jgi:hypothetical protein
MTKEWCAKALASQGTQKDTCTDQNAQVTGSAPNDLKTLLYKYKTQNFQQSIAQIGLAMVQVIWNGAEIIKPTATILASV